MRCFLLILILTLAAPARGAEAPPRTIPEVLARMEGIAAGLPPDDGVAVFDRLYLVTTRRLEGFLDGGRFENPAFMTELTVRFSGFYFDAVSSDLTAGGHPARAWMPLFRHRARAGSFREFQFASAGMEAHISRDLPVALATLFLDEPAFPARDTAIHRDFRRFNQVLAEAYADLHDELLAGPAWVRALGDELALPVLRGLRARAWRNGRTLWRFRHHPRAWKLYVLALDLATRLEADSSFLIHFQRHRAM